MNDAVIPQHLSPDTVLRQMKVVPEIENEAIGKRRKWMKRTRQQAISDLRQALQIS